MDEAINIIFQKTKKNNVKKLSKMVILVKFFWLEAPLVEEYRRGVLCLTGISSSKVKSVKLCHKILTLFF
ncbi:hypothetical protein RchiOBHm_Chr2g0157991 [Rosa chinensis]|uniref:Uncharacterized protein n=1 Tax=Rosa chinensis TaxID=74649 RepID=A0A2P6S1W4_ROSCH|nr:hypothetical protein RchiOBHm_Chr2g0157991 [Rosa chinensis]